MYNEVLNDPVLKGRYQFWLFQYSTGQPILYSALQLRRALRAVVAEVDPEGQDAALRRMVIVAHSQGGLLAKLTAVDAGDRFWRDIAKVPLADLNLSDDVRETFQSLR